MYHGCRWRTDPHYQAAMVETATCQVFVGDFITANAVGYVSGVVTAKILHLKQKV